MDFTILTEGISREEGVALSTMMGAPCLRCRGEFMGMFFEREDALIIKVSRERAEELIAAGDGREFRFTGKRFKEWVLIPAASSDRYEAFLYEALSYAREKGGRP